MSALQTKVAKAAASRRWKGEDHPDTIALRSELATEQIAVAVEKALATAPPLDDDQVERIAGLLRGGSDR